LEFAMHTPHVARHAGYALSQCNRKLVEQPWGTAYGLALLPIANSLRVADTRTARQHKTTGPLGLISGDSDEPHCWCFTKKAPLF
jgi:hypothetical protein